MDQFTICPHLAGGAHVADHRVQGPQIIAILAVEQRVVAVFQHGLRRLCLQAHIDGIDGASLPHLHQVHRDAARLHLGVQVQKALHPAVILHIVIAAAAGPHADFRLGEAVCAGGHLPQGAVPATGVKTQGAGLGLACLPHKGRRVPGAVGDVQLKTAGLQGGQGPLQLGLGAALAGGGIVYEIVPDILVRHVCSCQAPAGSLPTGA